MLQDLRYAFRTVLRSPGYALVAAGSVAIGVAGTATVFSVVNGLLLKPLPVAEPDRVAAVYTSDYSGTRYGSSSYPDLLSFKAGIPAFDHLIGIGLAPTSLKVGAEAGRAVVELVTSDYFSGLGIPLETGRSFLPEEERPGGASVLVVSYPVWQSRFGGRPDIVGQPVELGGHPFTIIGVAKRGFTSVFRGLGSDGWVPISADALLEPGNALMTERGNRSLFLYGHLAPGATLAQAESQAAAVAAQLHGDAPRLWSSLQGQSRTISIMSASGSRLHPDARGPVLGASALLFLVVVTILLIACANVAGLFLVRAIARQREIAVRLALGASRRRVVMQLVTESVMIALAGGAAGVLASIWLTQFVGSIRLPLPIPVVLDLSPDVRVFAFALLASVGAGVLVGLLPALQATNPELLPALKAQAGASRAERSRLRSAFVIGQAALTLTLLVVAGLFLRSLQHAATIDPGFGTRDGLVLETDLGLTGYSDLKTHQFQDQLVQQVSQLPGVTAAGLTATLPLSMDVNRTGIMVEGYAAGPNEDMEVTRGAVSPGFFEALQLPLVSGRGFALTDRTDTPPVAIVGEAFAHKYWPGQNPLGRRLSFQGDKGPWVEVVGVVHDAKVGSLSEAPQPIFYLPLSQSFRTHTQLLVRTSGSAATLSARLRDIVRQLDPAMPIVSLGTFHDHLSFSLLPARAGGIALGGFGLLGLLLASLGIYGVVAFGVSQRRREIGIRMALGAAGAQVVRRAVTEGMRLVLIGLGVGLLLASGAAVLARKLLYGLAPIDPLSFLGASLVFALVALVASWIPARRAARIDPMIAMRSE
ncbi:MAG: ABC transporter permease [Gemmatimonadota bacterium]